MIPIRFKRLHSEAKLPLQATSGSIGLDLFAFLISDSGRENTAMIPPRNTRMIPTGLLIDPPERQAHNGIGDRGGHQWLVTVVSRSGLASKSIFVTNAPGIIDPDYRGELKVLLYNGSHETFYVKHGDRIGQLVLVRAEYGNAVEVEELSPAASRGDAGFGSTGR